jgi:hypothetical protein
MDVCKEVLPVEPYDINEIPETFWNKDIFWWYPHFYPEATAFISEHFDFQNHVYEDGFHYFIYAIPSQRVCYILFLHNI